MKKTISALFAAAVALAIAPSASATLYTFTGSSAGIFNGNSFPSTPFTITLNVNGQGTLSSFGSGYNVYVLPAVTATDVSGGITHYLANVSLIILQNTCSNFISGGSATSCALLEQTVNGQEEYFVGVTGSFFSNYVPGTSTGVVPNVGPSSLQVGTYSIPTPPATSPAFVNNTINLLETNGGTLTITNYSATNETFKAPEAGSSFLYLLLAAAVCFGAMLFAPRGIAANQAAA